MVFHVCHSHIFYIHPHGIPKTQLRLSDSPTCPSLEKSGALVPTRMNLRFLLHHPSHGCLAASHRLDRLIEQLVQLPSKPLCAFGDHFSRASRRESLILELLLQALDFQIHRTLRRAHQRAGPDKPRQLI